MNCVNKFKRIYIFTIILQYNLVISRISTNTLYHVLLFVKGKIGVENFLYFRVYFDCSKRHNRIKCEYESTNS